MSCVLWRALVSATIPLWNKQAAATRPCASLGHGLLGCHRESTGTLQVVSSSRATFVWTSLFKEATHIFPPKSETQDLISIWNRRKSPLANSLRVTLSWFEAIISGKIVLLLLDTVTTGWTMLIAFHSVLGACVFYFIFGFWVFSFSFNIRSHVQQ